MNNKYFIKREVCFQKMSKQFREKLQRTEEAEKMFSPSEIPTFNCLWLKHYFQNPRELEGFATSIKELGKIIMKSTGPKSVECFRSLLWLGFYHFLDTSFSIWNHPCLHASYILGCMEGSKPISYASSVPSRFPYIEGYSLCWGVSSYHLIYVKGAQLSRASSSPPLYAFPLFLI